MPLAHGTRRGGVFAAAELDVTDDGFVRGTGEVVAQRLAVQAHFGHASREDFHTRPAGTAGPAVRLFACKLLGVRIKVGFGTGAGLAVPRAHAQHTFSTRRGHHIFIELEGRAHRCIEKLRIETNLFRLFARQNRVRRVSKTDEGVGVLVFHGPQHRRQVFHATRVALVFHHLDAGTLQRDLERCKILQPEQVVHVHHRHALDAVGLEHVHQRVAHRLGLLQQQKEVGQLHLNQPPGQRGRREKGVLEAVGQRRNRKVGVRAPGRQHQIDLVAAHQFLVRAHTGLDVAAVVRADQLNGSPCAAHAQAARRVLLLGPKQVVWLLTDLRTACPRSGAGDGITHTHRLGLGKKGRRKGGCANGGCGALEQLAFGWLDHGGVSCVGASLRTVVSRW